MTLKRVHIIGGGIIGLCSAYYLNKEGIPVTIVDRGYFKDGTSFGNNGMIVPSHFIPMATPGVITQGLKWLLNSKSPFYVKPRLNLDLMQWMWRFHKSANAKQVSTSAPHLYALNELSRTLYKEISAQESFDFEYGERGLLMLYKSKKQEEEEEELAEAAHQMGIRAEILGSAELRKLEPKMDLNVRGGLYFPGDSHLYPNLLISNLISVLKERGVEFKSGTEIADFKTDGTKILSLVTKKGENIEVEEVLLTGGAWTGQLLKKLGVKIHLQDGKGYSIMVQDLKERPQIPTILSEAKVAITPMGKSLRVGGTLELSGLSKKISPKRVEGIVESIPSYYNNLEIPYNEGMDVWTGYRPCTPDGMPYIGRSKKLLNLIVGTGHGMMGLSLGAASGLLLSQIITEQKKELDLSPYRLERF